MAYIYFAVTSVRCLVEYPQSDVRWKVWKRGASSGAEVAPV
jgi:hypothetical protein